MSRRRTGKRRTGRRTGRMRSSSLAAISDQVVCGAANVPPKAAYTIGS